MNLFFQFILILPLIVFFYRVSHELAKIQRLYNEHLSRVGTNSSVNEYITQQMESLMTM